MYRAMEQATIRRHLVRSWPNTFGVVIWVISQRLLALCPVFQATGSKVAEEGAKCRHASPDEGEIMLDAAG